MAKKRKAKYHKKYLETWRCKGCEFEWSYKTMKCPICSGNNTIKIL